MKQYRLNRLFHPVSGRCFDVAVDHGMPGEPGMLEGIEDMAAVVARLVEARPDAVQLSVGQADLLQRHPGRDKPALVLRTDTGNVYGGPVEAGRGWALMIDDPVGQAVRFDAACVVANLLDLPDHPEVRRDCVEAIMHLRAACDRAAMPLMVEPLALLQDGGGYDSSFDAERIAGVVRQAVELGADVIKADPTADAAAYRRIVTIARVPLLVRGGGRVTDREILERTHALLAQGAAGIVYGRNVIQHPDPTGMTRALMAVVHDGATPDAAMAGLA